MRRILHIVCALAVCALAFGGAPGARAAGGIARDRRFLADVDRAIRDGVEWLLKQQQGDGGFGTYGGYPAAQTAIAYHTLRVCGVPRSDRDMERAYDALRREYLVARESGQLRTYTAALIMMAIESRGLVDERSSTNPRRYGNADAKKEKDLDARDREWMEELVEFVEGNQNAAGAWTYGQPAGRYTKRLDIPANHYDHSNTQYALLGLKSAARTGVRVDPEVFEKALEHLLDAQDDDGPEVPRVEFHERGETHTRTMDRARGWAYRAIDGTTDRRAPMSAYGSMTAGSLGAVVICRSELQQWRGYSSRLDARAEQSLWDGIAWLGKYFTVTANPNRGGWHYYYLYGLERAGVLAGVDWMGEHDWYGRGADYLIANQEREGSWADAGPRIVTTCFALLFLKRGTMPVSRGAVTPSGGADDIDFRAAAGLEGKALEDFVDLVVGRWRRAASESQRTVLRRGIASVGERVVLPLLKRMGAGGEEQRLAAHSLLVDVTGQTFLYDAVADAETRLDQLIPWEEWAMARLGRLVFDEKTGTLVTR